MSRKLYKKIDGVYQWIDLDETSKAQESPFIHNDTLERPLRNPADGKIYESRREYEKSVKRMGLEIVGNEKLSQKPRQLQDKVTETQIMDAIHRAEAIHSDPAKLRAQREENYRRLERAERTLHGKG